MTNVPSNDYEEIDFFGFINHLWDGKWILLFTIVISLISVLSFNLIKPNKSFTAITKIKPITSYEYDNYRLFNATEFFDIKKNDLLNLYIEQIEEGSLLEEGIDKLDLINIDDFNTKSEYNEAIEKIASNIRILNPPNLNLDEQESNYLNSYHELTAQFNDQEKWKKFLLFVNEEANRKVKDIINNRFNMVISIKNQELKFALQDLELKIENIKKDYYLITEKKLAFLSEQAAIARKLGIKKHIINSQVLDTQIMGNKSLIDAPFYLRGYEAIEKEISLINNRENKDLFINELYLLEQDKRNLEQDVSIKRAMELFNETPLNSHNFKSVIVKVASTDFQKIRVTSKYYFLALFFGFILGLLIIYYNNMAKSKKNTVNL